jgi:Dolichyl-phosphate-mannose-protein mannosyltransferase
LGDEPTSVATHKVAAQNAAAAGSLATRHLPLVSVFVAAVIRIPTLAMPLIEAHAFRQTQTAFPAVLWRDSPIDLMHPEVPVLGPPWSIPFEFPIVQAAGALLIRLGLSPEIAMRGLALSSFLATAVVLWTILTRHVGRRSADIAIVVFLFSPFAMEWSRASLIEYPATFFALLFVLAVLEGAGRNRLLWLVVALVSGAFVALIKLTTAVFWLAPAVLTRRLAVLASVGLAAAIGIAWSAYAEGIRAANPFAGLLIGPGFLEWNVGGDRLSLSTWAAATIPGVCLAGMLLLPLGIAVRHRPERFIWIWMAIAMIGPILLFTNLYAQHQYYTAAISPAIAAFVGGGVDEWLRRRPSSALLFVGVAATTLVVSWPIWSIAYTGADPDHVLATASEIRAITRPNDLVALHHFDWTPAYLFYAGRRGLVLPVNVPAPPGFVDVGTK